MPDAWDAVVFEAVFLSSARIPVVVAAHPRRGRLRSADVREAIDLVGLGECCVFCGRARGLASGIIAHAPLVHVPCESRNSCNCCVQKLTNGVTEKRKRRHGRIKSKGGRKGGAERRKEKYSIPEEVVRWPTFE